MSVHRPLGATPQTGALELPRSALDAPHGRAGRRLALLGLAGMVTTGLLIALGAAATDTLLPETLRPVPTWLAGPFGSTELNLGGAGVIAVLALMFACYVIAVRGADRVSPRTVLMTIAAVQALVLLAPTLISTDVFSYQAYGRMGALMGINPYLQGPHAIALDSVFPYVGAKWSYIPTAYGPVFTALSYLLAPLSIAGARGGLQGDRGDRKPRDGRARVQRRAPARRRSGQGGRARRPESADRGLRGRRRAQRPVDAGRDDGRHLLDARASLARRQS